MGESTDSMPDDVRCDYALHFDIWSLDDEKLNKCFSLFPNGNKVLARAKQVISSPPVKQDVGDGTLLALLDEMNTSINHVLQEYGDESVIKLNDEKHECDGRSVYRGDEALRSDIFNQADSPTIHLDDELSELVKNKLGELGKAAFFFLDEPLYRLGGNDYAVAHWVLWAMIEDDYKVDPYRPGYELYKMKAQAG